MARARRKGDLTVAAVPFYFASMGAEYWWLRKQAATRGPSGGDYERRDTLASLAMGVGSLVAPLAVGRLLRPLVPGRGRYGKWLVAAAAGAVAVTTAADALARRGTHPSQPPDPGAPGLPDARTPPESSAPVARRVASVGGASAVALGALAVSATWQGYTAPEQLWRHRLVGDLGNGPLAVLAAVLGWDFVYYWNHRMMHECRYLWADHVVHHSSEHYNLSTALRQPVADALLVTVPYGLLCLLGVSPGLVLTARGVNLLYQFWIHTETVGRLGPPEAVLNTPSHHRVHHGSNRQYLDRNHGSILIVWDRLFGTFEPEDERVVYGLTKNIDTFNLAKIIGHEYADILQDVAASTTWRERLSYVLRGPGWSTRHRAEVAALATARPVLTAAG